MACSTWTPGYVKATGQAAYRFGLRDRGYLQRGKIADLVVFDPDSIADRATYEDPLQPPLGVREVLCQRPVCGQGGEMTLARLGPGSGLMRRSARRGRRRNLPPRPPTLVAPPT